MIPVIKQGVNSMISRGYHVDVYIISHYKMTRKSLVISEMAEISSNITVRFWDNAAPISYGKLSEYIQGPSR